MKTFLVAGTERSSCKNSESDILLMVSAECIGHRVQLSVPNFAMKMVLTRDPLLSS